MKQWIASLALVAVFFSIPHFLSHVPTDLFYDAKAYKTLTESWTEALNVESEFISQIKTTKFPIGILEVQWDADIPEGAEMRLYMQFFEKGTWTLWQRVHADIDTKEGGEETLLSSSTARTKRSGVRLLSRQASDRGSINREIPDQVSLRGEVFASRMVVSRRTPLRSVRAVRNDRITLDEALHEHIQSQTAIVIANQAEKLRYKIILKTDDTEEKPTVKSLKFTNIFSPRLPSDSAPKNSARAQSRFQAQASAYPQTSALAQSLDDEIFDPKEVDFDTIISGLNVITENSSKIISRKEWGADESLRMLDETSEQNMTNGAGEKGETTEDKTAMEEEFYENFKAELSLDAIIETDEQGQKMKWPIEIAKNIKKVIIHHTATTSNLDNPKAAIRSIYYYHAIKRKWGDIGYNYIIDTAGNVYEGRAGGEKVVGGHASKYNTGSIGIAVLGNYSENEVPYAVLQSLINLIGEKALLYNIKADGSGMFRGKNLPNILGHRDVGETDCPGAKLYSAIPSLRKIIAASTGLMTENVRATGSDGFDFEEVGTRSLVVLKPNSTQKITFSLQNTGSQTWDSATFLVANDNADALGKINTAPMKKSSVAPGQTGTFEITVLSLLKGGITTFDITPIFNGKKKLQKYITLPMYVSPPKLSYAIYEMPAPPKTNLKRGEQVTTWIKLQNTGDVPWRNDGETPVRLGTVNPKNRQSAMKNGENRIGFLKQKEVKPGEIGHFELEFTAPNTGGTYVEQFTPVMDGIGWMPEDKNLKLVFTVEGATYKGELISMSASAVFQPGEKKAVWMVLKNTGDVVWQKKGAKAIKVGVVKPKGSIVTAILMEQSSVNPGETGKWNFSIKAPEKAGKYRVYLRPRVGGKLLTQKPIIVRFQVSKETTSENNLIRVALGFSGNPIMTADGSFVMEVEGSETASFVNGEKAEVSFQNGKYLVKKGEEVMVLKNYPRFVPNEGAILRIDNFTNRPSWSQNANDNQYRGMLEVREIDGALTVINELPLEDYLKGVAEPAESDPFEKIKALAILARTYARYYIEIDRKFPGKPYDGSDDPGIFQRYLGYGYELRADNMRRAVSETEGLVVTYQGKIVKTPYFHASDGRTRSGEEVFGWTHTPYLQSVPDPYCEGQKLSGHGVGLSGCGSYGMAKAGKTYEEIIKYYFQGVEIEKRE